MKLNGELMARQRRSLALTYRQIGIAIGTSGGRIRGFEQGESAGFMTLLQFQRLADVLAIDATDLHEPTIDDVEPHSPEATQKMVGALLATAGDVMTPLATLAHASGSSIRQARSATHHLDEELRPLGMRLHSTAQDRDIRIVADGSALTERQVAILHRGISAGKQLTISDARFIHRMITKPPTAKSVQQSNNGRVRLGRLINAGIVKPPRRQIDRLEFTDDTKLSLMLDA